MQLLPLRLTRLAPLALVALVLTTPTCAKEPAPAPAPPPPAPAQRVAAVAQINHQTCVVVGNQGDTTVIDWNPAEPQKPVEVKWESTGKPQGYTVKIGALTGPGEQSPDPKKQAEILAMFELKYEIGKDGTFVLSNLPKNPPFGEAKDVRWKYQVQVLDANGAVVCGKDPDVCIRQPGGCGG